MEPLTIVVDELKRFAKTANDFAQGCLSSSRRTPIEILKRLQREAFSDIMKLRDRQDKVERLLTFYKSSKGGPFQDASTHVRGSVDVQGAFFIMDDVDEQKFDAIQSSGLRTGIDARLRFETAVREKDQLLAEFSTTNSSSDMLGGPLSLAKVLYIAHFNDWFSAVAIPMGAQCRDVGLATSTHQEKGLTSYSDFGPPLLHRNDGSAIGITMRKTNITASFAQFVSGHRKTNEFTCNLSTFGQIVCQLSRNTKLSLLGVHRESRAPGQSICLGPLSFPVSICKRKRISETSVEEDSPKSHNSDAALSLMLNSEIDDSTKVGGWIETKTSKPGQLEWAVAMCDDPEDGVGLGVSLGGLLQGPRSLKHFQVETYLSMKFGGRFALQPGLVYVKDGATQYPALMIRSSWSL